MTEERIDYIVKKNGFVITAGFGSASGGGGTTDVVRIGEKTVKFGHGKRHLKGTRLTERQVNDAIAKEVAELNLKAGQFHKGRVEIDGYTIEYTSYGLSEGTVNVGTYYTID